MFLNYHNIADNYVPNNLITAFPNQVLDSKLYSVTASKPYEEYDAKGNLTGYFWRYGDTLNLEFNIDGEVTVESNAIVFTRTGVVPTTATLATIGQRAYNLIDLRSWTCVSINKSGYVWEEDAVFEYPIDSTRSIYIFAEDYLKDKNVEVTIYNFRMEPIVQKVYAGNPIIVFSIDSDLSKQLVKGIYYCGVRVFNDVMSNVIFESTDCNLLVK